MQLASNQIWLNGAISSGHFGEKQIFHINQECLMKSSQATLVHLHFTLDYYQAGNDL